MVKVLSEMQIASSTIWTLLTVIIYNDDVTWRVVQYLINM